MLDKASLARSSQNCLIVADFTVNPIVPLLQEKLAAQQIKVVAVSLDHIVPALESDVHPAWASQPDFAIIWTRPEKISTIISDALQSDQIDLEALKRDTLKFSDLVAAFAARRRLKAVFVANWMWPSWKRGLGLRELKPGLGISDAIRRMNIWLADSLAEKSGTIYLLDADRWAAKLGETAFDQKLWFLAKIPFSNALFKEAASEIGAAIRAVRGLTRKLLVLDLDDTLWGGVVGDVGWKNIRLGGHDAVGEAFGAFQQGIKALTRRGVILGIVSKNTEAVALEAIDKHPDMVLRRSDFAGWRINWNDKAQNLSELVGELNLGLDSVVYVDDDPTQRSRIRDAFPDVLVPDWPSNKLLYRQALDCLDCFDAAIATEEDSKRSEMYQREKIRRAAMVDLSSHSNWLSSLQLKVRVQRLSDETAKRAAQLLNKTNQMNLTTRRMTESEMIAWSQQPENDMLVFSVSDRFGDYGLTGIASANSQGGVTKIMDFVMSCRVIDRGVEDVLLYCICDLARERSAKKILAVLKPTDRNTPCRLFFESRSGFENILENTYELNVSKSTKAPSHIEIETKYLAKSVA